MEVTWESFQMERQKIRRVVLGVEEKQEVEKSLVWGEGRLKFVIVWIENAE